jgi:hypothetical protein
MKTENLVDHALAHLDNWLHEPARLTEVSNEQLELLGSISILTAHLEAQRIAAEVMTSMGFDAVGVPVPADMPFTALPVCCATFVTEAIAETLEIFTDDTDHPAVLKLREAREIMEKNL